MFQLVCRASMVSLLILSVLPLTASAEHQQLRREAARRDLKAAEIRLRLYVNEEYPRALRRLDREIELAIAHLLSHQRRVAEYSQFDKFESSNPLFLTLEKARLALLAAELRLEDLHHERRLLEYNHRDRCRLLELDVAEATARFKAIRR